MTPACCSRRAAGLPSMANSGTRKPNLTMPVTQVLEEIQPVLARRHHVQPAVSAEVAHCEVQAAALADAGGAVVDDLLAERVAVPLEVVEADGVILARVAAVLGAVAFASDQLGRPASVEVGP